MLQQGRDNKIKIMEMMLTPKTPIVTDEQITEVLSFIASLKFEAAMDYYRKDLRVSKYLAKEGLKLALQAPDQSLIARFEYHLGMIAFLRGHFDRAFAHFKAVESHVMDDEFLARGLLHMCHSEDRDNFRWQALRTHFNGHVDANALRKMGIVPPPGALLKRKRDGDSWELVLRPVPAQHKEQSAKSKPTVWMVHDTEDTPQHHNRVPAKGDKNISRDMDWLNKPNLSGPPLEQCQFTFRCYHTGLAPRTRPTTMFPRQRGDVNMSQEKWESVE